MKTGLSNFYMSRIVKRVKNLDVIVTFLAVFMEEHSPFLWHTEMLHCVKWAKMESKWVKH